MKQLWVRLLSICSIILLKVCVLVRGRYLVEVRIFGYDNPTQRCQDCRDGQFANPGCCDGFTAATCPGALRCDSYFFYCLRTIGSSGRNCSYFGNRISDCNQDDEPISFNRSSVLGLENPLQLQGLTNAYAYIQVYIEIHDRDSAADSPDEFVDAVAIDHSLAVGQATQRRNHTGVFGFVTMDLSITVLCAHNFQGADCTQCTPPGFTGPDCNEIDDCVGVSCGNGECVDGINSFSCACDPGFTGELCRTSINISENEMRDSNLIGPIIGGALGSLCVLLLLLLLAVTMIFVKILTYRKSEDKTTHIRQELVPVEEGIKITSYRMYDGSLRDEQGTALYEDIAEVRPQYVNVSRSDSSTSDSAFVNNPICGDEDANTGNQFYVTSVDDYDQTFQQPAPPAAVEDKEFSASYGRVTLQVSIEENVAYGRRDSITCDSELEDNPIYGGEEMNVGDGINLTSPHRYDRTFQTLQAPADSVNQEASYDKMAKVNPEATRKNHVYDYIDAKI